jgi:hypothetical protein
MKKLGIDEMFLSIIKAVYDKPINVILHEEKLIPFPMKSGIRQGCLPSPVLFNILIDFLAREIKQEKEIKGIQIEKES